MVGAIRTAALEVKFLDRCKTNNSESIWQERFHRSRTKVKGSKTIRYRRSLNHKLCRLEIGGCYFMTPSASYEKSKSLGSGGSMVARLKLKGIDGRAPPGVELAAQFDSTRENLPGPDIVRIDRLIALS